MAHHVDLWVGRFKSRAACSSYFSEEFDEETGDRPISQFAADLEQPFYDHDSLETSYHSRAATLAEMLAGHSGAASFVDAAGAVFDQREWPKSGGRVNTVVLAFDDAIDQPRDVAGPGYWLTYLGRFDCDLAAGAAEGDAGPPTGITLTVVGGGPIPWNGKPVTVVPVDARGMLFGRGEASPDDPPCLDLSDRVPDIAVRQLLITRDQFDQWQIEELAGNDLVRFRGQPFSHSRAFPWHGQRIEIGSVELEWTVE
jgi:hypothetical protein